MQLIPCHRPSDPLERAPRTSLRADSEHQRWEGFWCVADERYYARCVHDDGSEQWHRLVDEIPRERQVGARVIPLRPRLTHDARRTLTNDARRTYLLVPRVTGWPILIGALRRRSRPGAGGVR